MAEIHQPSGRAICQQVRRDHGPTTLLAFSAGKDSIAAALALQAHFDEIVPIYFYSVPDLEFVEESLRHYEKTLFGRNIIRMPHPSLYRMLNAFVYQPPHRVPVIEAADLPEFTFKEAHDLVRAEYGAQGSLCATGVRAADSPIRRVSIQQHGPISRNKGEFFPIWDWKKADLAAAFTKHKIRLSREYDIFGRSWDGFDVRFMIPMRSHFPRDYAKILEWFPLLEADIFRFERMKAQ